MTGGNSFSIKIHSFLKQKSPFPLSLGALKSDAKGIISCFSVVKYLQVGIVGLCASPYFCTVNE